VPAFRLRIFEYSGFFTFNHPVLLLLQILSLRFGNDTFQIPSANLGEECDPLGLDVDIQCRANLLGCVRTLLAWGEWLSVDPHVGLRRQFPIPGLAGFVLLAHFAGNC
jgi:hypothetical protein